ncbi:MAG TPA: prepilin peptidase [Planctomycetota bacterium]|nr:prepilin peptidase [Planctomycetota bacterium]
MAWLAIAMAGVFGAFVGSFLNVCVYRLPRNQSVVAPPSRCLSCGTRLRWSDNLPLIGYALLRGRCRWCGTRYGSRYVWMELLVATLTALIAWRVLSAPGMYVAPWLTFVDRGTGIPSWAVAMAVGALAVLVWYLLVSALIDLDHMIIPDELTKSFQVAAPFVAVATGIGLQFEWAPDDWLARRSALGAFVGTPARFLWWFGGIVAGALAFLALSLPLARRIYSTYCPLPWRWSDDDHRGFRIGVLWFMGATVPPAAIALALVWATPLPTAAGDGASGAVARLAGAAHLANAVLGSLAGWLSLYLVGLIGTVAFRRNAMGFGDVKFLAPVGAFLGPIGVIYAFSLAAVCGAVIGIPMRLLARQREIPFGPYLALGALASALFAPALHRWLLDLPVAP